MNNPENKNHMDFLDEIIALGFDTEKKSEFLQMLSDYLLKHTQDGRLYKYRAFDSNGYALNSLITGTLYCARPDSFNDPFDCRLGITYTALANSLIDSNTMEQALSNVIDYFRREIPLDNCNTDAREIIVKLIENGSLESMLRGDELNNTEKEIAFKSIIKETIIYTLSKKMGKVPEGLAEFIDSMDIPKIATIESCPKLGDYLSSVGYIAEDKDEVANMLDYVSSVRPGNEQQVAEANDLFSSMEKDLTKTIADTFLVGCLATDPRQRLMWSHYSEGHRGFCIEYDVKALLEKEPVLFPVMYSTKRPLIPFDAVSNPKVANEMKARINMLKALLTKDKCWEYENEWRIIIPAKDNADVEIPITAIYLGANIRPENKAIILEIAQNHKITVEQMIIDRGEYKLHSTRLLDFKGE